MLKKYTKSFAALSFLLIFLAAAQFRVHAQEDIFDDQNQEQKTEKAEKKEKKEKAEQKEKVEKKEKAEKKKKEKKGLFKKKKKKSRDSIPEAEEVEDISPKETDSLSQGKKKKSRKGLFSRKRKSKGGDRDSLNSKSSEGGASEPEEISRKNWNSYSRVEQDSILRAWDSYDKQRYRKKYAYSEKQRKILHKTKPTFFDKMRYRLFIRNKPMRYKKKLMKRKNKRYLKAGRIEKSADIQGDSLSSDSTFNRHRYREVNRRYRADARKEAVKKNKVILKYDKKEERLIRKYKLSDEESVAFYKGRGTRLKGRELMLFKSASRKKEVFALKMTKLRQERSYALQNKDTRKHMRKDKRRLKKRDTKRRKKKKNRRQKNDKYNSYEYPDKYHKKNDK